VSARITDRCRRAVESVRRERGLDHRERVDAVLAVELLAVVRRLVRAVVEHLQELRPPKVEHERRVELEIWRKSKGGRVLLCVLSELLAESNELSVNPAEDVRTVVRLGFVHRVPCHQHASSLWVRAWVWSGWHASVRCGYECKDWVGTTA
jgi:hypothetical protein